MDAKTTMIKPGVWEVVDIGNKYLYRVCTSGGRLWSIFKWPRDPEAVNPKWRYVETGYKSKASAVEMVVELAARENFNPVADHLNNIDDGINLNEEGRY